MITTAQEQANGSQANLRSSRGSLFSAGNQKSYYGSDDRVKEQLGG